MAAETLTTTRRALLGAAVAFPILALSEIPGPAVLASAARQSSSATATWDHRLARYRRLAAYMAAEAETGTFRAANDGYNRIYADLSDRFGSWEKARRSRLGKRLCAAAFARIDAAEDAYYLCCIAPTQRAAVRLALTPAPDFEALAVKIRIMHERELDELSSMERPVLEVLAEDVRRLFAPTF